MSPVPDAQPQSRRSVLVIGATGRVGRVLVGQLLDADVEVRALTRRPAEAAFPAAVQVVAGDLNEPQSLDAALNGVDAVFLLWTAAPSAAAAAIERIASHARRIVFLSSPHTTPHPFFQQPNPMAAFHVEMERLIAATGVESTIIRPGMFAANSRLWWGASIQNGDVVHWPYAAAQTAPIDERDIAAVATRALSTDDCVGDDYVLTGPEALSHAEQVGIIGDVLGRQLRYDEMSPDEFRRRMPPAAAEMLLAAWSASIGHPAWVTTTVADVTGIPARTFRDWVTDHADAFRSRPS